MKNTRTIVLINTIILALFVVAVVLISRDAASKKNDEAPVIDNEWALFLITPNYPLTDDYAFDISAVYEQFSLDSRCAEYAKEMLKAAEKDGINLNVVSAYRSIQKQTENFYNYKKRLIAEGHSEHEAENLTALEIAPAGASEHNAGLALDILTMNWWDTHDDVTADFEDTKEFEWLKNHSWEYGFILRYPKDMEHITGYLYEPWHYRFVGKYYAAEIFESGLTLEEYIRSQ